MLYYYKAKLIRILDGDTVELEIDLGCRIFRREICRFLGIDAPELKTELGIGSKNWLKLTLESIPQLYIKTHLDKDDKYGRLLVEIFRSLDKTETSLNEEMVSLGYARRM